MLKIVVRTVPHKQQRYPTCGDWYELKDGTWVITVSEMGDWRYELLIALHEIVEYSLCKVRKITDREVTRFDKQFERERLAGKQPAHVEPGDDPRCPCVAEHFFATNIERLLAAELGVKWPVYEMEVELL